MSFQSRRDHFEVNELAPSNRGVKSLLPLVSLILANLMILLIDNYDSFTHNLVHLIGGAGKQVEVRRNDALSPNEAMESAAEAVVISPGPGEPNQAGICIELIKMAADRQMPVFGVCLGMQAIAEAFGGTVERAGKLMHGKTCGIIHNGQDLFKGLPSPFTATRYHSLAVRSKGLPEELAITASAQDDNEVMAINHTKFPIAGVQFHPESIASEHGKQIVLNFLAWANV